MEHSENLNELAMALAKAQAKLPGATKDKVNPAFRSKYADLASVWDACREPLAENGLSVVQTFEPAPEGHLMLRSTLLHSSGQWYSGLCLMPLAKMDPPGYGSGATYARRYGLAALVGVCPEDDDGNAATVPQQANRQADRREEPRNTATQQHPAPQQSHQCSVETCRKPLTKGQHDVSVRACGRALCPACERELRDSAPVPAPKPDDGLGDLRNQLAAAYKQAGLPASGEAFYAWCTQFVGRPITGRGDLTGPELTRLIAECEAVNSDPFQEE